VAADASCWPTVSNAMARKLQFPPLGRVNASDHVVVVALGEARGECPPCPVLQGGSYEGG
jgi:hypothetical protein